MEECQKLIKLGTVTLRPARVGIASTTAKSSELRLNVPKSSIHHNPDSVILFLRTNMIGTLPLSDRLVQRVCQGMCDLLEVQKHQLEVPQLLQYNVGK